MLGDVVSVTKYAVNKFSSFLPIYFQLLYIQGKVSQSTPV